MSKKADPEQFTLPIDLATYRNFFGLDFLESHNRFANVSPEATPHRLASFAAGSMGLPENIVQEIQEAVSNPNGSSLILSEMEGGFSIVLQYKVGALTTHIIASGILTSVPIEEGSTELAYSLVPISLLIGFDDGASSSQPSINPLLVRCRVKDMSSCESWPDYPTTENEFLAHLNYMRFALLSSAYGDKMDVEINQLELAPSRIDIAQNTFANALGYQDIKTALGSYRDTRISYETLLGLHKLEISNQAPLRAPTRHFH
jgi:hypothetical protein